MITGGNIIDLRYLLQITQQDFAKDIGVDVLTVQRWESCPGRSVKGSSGHFLLGIFNDLIRNHPMEKTNEWNSRNMIKEFTK